MSNAQEQGEAVSIVLAVVNDQYTERGPHLVYFDGGWEGGSVRKIRVTNRSGSKQGKSSDLDKEIVGQVVPIVNRHGKCTCTPGRM